jgi:hypothetical protein
VVRHMEGWLVVLVVLDILRRDCAFPFETVVVWSAVGDRSRALKGIIMWFLKHERYLR